MPSPGCVRCTENPHRFADPQANLEARRRRACCTNHQSHRPDTADCDDRGSPSRLGILAIVQESLPRDTLKEICDAVGRDDTGKEKTTLVERILAAASVKTANGVGYTIDPSATKASTEAEGAAFGAQLPRLFAHTAIKDAPLVERVATITEDAQAHHTSRVRNGGFAHIFHDLEMMERLCEGGLLSQARGAA